MHVRTRVCAHACMHMCMFACAFVNGRRFVWTAVHICRKLDLATIRPHIKRRMRRCSCRMASLSDVRPWQLHGVNTASIIFSVTQRRQVLGKLPLELLATRTYTVSMFKLPPSQSLFDFSVRRDSMLHCFTAGVYSILLQTQILLVRKS